jgi:uncharacterized protein YcbX
MAEVAALARYPVKGLTPEPQDALVVQPDGRAAGDRVLAFRFADATLPETRDGLDYWPKQRGLALLDFPSLARLRLTYDHEGRRLRITDGDRTLVEAGLWDGARRRIADAVTAWVLATPEGPLLGRPGRLPLELVGDGAAARFQDRPRGFVTLHSQASVEAVASRPGRNSSGRPRARRSPSAGSASRSPGRSNAAWRSRRTPRPAAATPRC